MDVLSAKHATAYAAEHARTKGTCSSELLACRYETTHALDLSLSLSSTAQALSSSR